MLSSRNGASWSFPKYPEVSKRELYFKDGSKRELSRLERPFIYRDKNGKPLALFAAAAYEAPVKGDPMKVDDDHNTFNVCIPLLIK